MTAEARPFVPPHPARPTRRLPLPALLLRLRRNLLEVWHADQFAAEFIATRVLRTPVFICNGPASIDAFVAEHAALSGKTAQMRRSLAPLIGEGVIIADGPAWRAGRRVAAPLTAPGRIAALMPAIGAAVADVHARWAARPEGAVIDMLAEMGALTADALARALFGRALGEADAGQVAGAFAAWQRHAGAGGALALLGLPAWPSLRRRPEPARLGAVLARLTAALPVAAAGERGLREEAATLFLAGHETTAATLAWAWYLLSQDAPTAARLAGEARAVLGGRAAGAEDLAALPLARAVFEETLRLYPPIPLLARRASRAVTLAGHAVPRGSIVMLVPWLLHRNPRLWAAPDAFRPDRFLAPMPRPARNTFLPFSTGPRACTGAAFAMAEGVAVLATLAQTFAPRLAPGAQVFPVCRLTLRPGETLPMLLHRAA